MRYDLAILIGAFAFVLFCHGVHLWLHYKERQNLYGLRNERGNYADTQPF